MTVKVLSREPEENFVPATLTGHKRSVVGAWFGPGGAQEVISVSADGGMFLWERSALTGWVHLFMIMITIKKFLQIDNR